MKSSTKKRINGIVKRDSDLIKEIAERAVRMAANRGIGKWEIGDAVMDITVAHEDCPLRLSDLLYADDFNFAHDVFPSHWGDG